MRIRTSARTTMLCATLALMTGSATAASAQTTLTLNQPGTHVVYTTIRAGQYANTNQGNDLETKTTSDPDSLRRALLKFDTQNTIPQGTVVTSAKLTMTVASGGATATRHIAAYQVTQSWDETEATWNTRRAGLTWSTVGGDVGTKLATVAVSNAPGTKVTFDVTPLVAQAVSGALGSSRYTRIALVDVDPADGESRRIFVMPDAATASERPTLVVTLGSSSTTTQSGTSGKALRVLEYNVHHNGIGTDGVNNPNRIADWVAKLNPDVVTLVEVESQDSYYSGDGVALYRKLLESRTGVTWYSLDIQKYGDWTSPGQRNAILSKYPFSSTYRHEFSVGDPRTVGGVTISVNGRNINFMSTHLDWQVERNRATQATELVSYAVGFAQDRIVAGDFNGTPGSTEIDTMTAGYTDSWVAAKALGTAVSAPDNPNGNTRNGRIDFVFTSHSTSHLILKSVTVVDTRDSNGVMPSDHRPLLAVFTVN